MDFMLNLKAEWTCTGETFKAYNWTSVGANHFHVDVCPVFLYYSGPVGHCVDVTLETHPT